MIKERKLHGYDDGWDTDELNDSVWNTIIEIQNKVNHAKMFFNGEDDCKSTLFNLKEAKKLITKLISKHG